VEHSVEGLLTVIGVRYTTARSVAARAIDQISAKLERPVPPSTTGFTPVYGGRIERLADLVERAAARAPPDPERCYRAGADPQSRLAYTDVFRYLDQNPGWGESLGFVVDHQGGGHPCGARGDGAKAFGRRLQEDGSREWKSS
jgi:glycerol-3-phosphate dehydrogenase